MMDLFDLKLRENEGEVGSRLNPSGSGYVVIFKLPDKRRRNSITIISKIR